MATTQAGSVPSSHRAFGQRVQRLPRKSKLGWRSWWLARAVDSRGREGSHASGVWREPVQGDRPAEPGRWRTGAALTLRVVVILISVALAAPGCDGGGIVSDADVGPPPTIEASVLARPWASSKAAGQAFGHLWREATRNPRDRDGRGVDAYNWAGRTCDAVRTGATTPEVMVRRVRDEGRFTQQGATVIVTAALRALCPADSPLPP
jgi:hypothetical protein